ncbi:sensor histidine kinase [Acetanaerobacterium elongatum]|uniref:Two-component system, sensor histidine kinase YesM n=1 Tax=Acetanaerobacterium elongatum TaxID=258515 RepID=A0A1G9W9K8_9FIRM|nr:sensor histidine kinase [Acetanaerobacterium elongatum]SDM80953.1 two-component system, sensor histidine kinase YesM [Acetanaerobacterium elongatum]
MPKLSFVLQKASFILKKPLQVLYKLYKNLPIRGKFLLVLNSIILIPLITISYISYKNTEDALKAKSVQYSQDILQMVQLRLVDSLSKISDISNDLLADERIYNVVDSLSKDRNSLENYEVDTTVNNILKNILSTRDGALSIGIFPSLSDGFIVNSFSAPGRLKDILDNNRQFYRTIYKSARANAGLPVYVVDENNNVFLVRTMYNHDTYQESGVLVILISPEYLSKAFNGLVSDDVQNLEIVSGNKAILQKVNYSLMGQPDYGKLQGKGWFIDSKYQRLISYSTNADLGWKLVSYVSLSSLYADVYKVRQTIVVACVIAVLLMSLIGVLMSVDFASSIGKLVSGMERVRKGETDVTIALERKDEIGYMGETFNHMISEITTLEKWVFREQLTRKEAELKALQSQINPHFLFNTLETVNWMAILNNVPEISKTITALSSLMEASIMRGDAFIPLSEEFTYIDNFIYILTKRFEDRLTVDKQIDPAALSVVVPKLLIQPLVENAIYHGVENSRGQCRVYIGAQVADQLLCITVEDNGAGMDEQELAALKTQLAVEDNTYFTASGQSKRKGVGLNNVNRRIKLYYGPEYGLDIESKKGEYTRILVKIPLTVKERVNASMKVLTGSAEAVSEEKG